MLCGSLTLAKLKATAQIEIMQLSLGRVISGVTQRYNVFFIEP
jgi:hypothetical protein